MDPRTKTGQGTALELIRTDRLVVSFISGLIGIPFIALFFSSDPSRIRIRPILFGLTVQVLMGVICFQFPIGRDAIQSAASAVQKGVNYSQAGAEFVFGDRFVKNKFGP